MIEEVSGQQVVHTPCDVALAQGIMPGMPLNAAYVLCKNLAVGMRDLTGEKTALQSLAQRVARFTPGISLSPPDALLLEVSKSLRLFGGFDQLLNLVREEFDHQQIISSAPSPAAASLLARNGIEDVVRRKNDLKSVLGGLRITDTDLPFTVVQQLSKCGLRTLRDLWRLSRPDLARRFGMELIVFLDKACGAEPDPKKRMTTQTRFFQRVELPAETKSSKLLLIAAERLFEKAHRFLQSHASATEKMVFKLWHRHAGGENKPCSTLVIRSQQADRRPQRFLPQFRERVESMTLAAPVESISLRIDQVLPYVGESRDLFSDTHSDHRADHQNWHQLIDILDARLGAEMVYCVSIEDDHRPEKAWRIEAACPKKLNKTNRQLVAVPARPLWLLSEPKKIPGQHPDLKLVSETERIEGGWWQGQDVRRDYYIASTRYGSLCWVFQDVIEEDPAWYVHGVYG